MVSAEFPGTRVGLAPKGWATGRPFGKLIWVVIHSTEGSEDPNAAENGNAYDARRTDGTSTHVFVDSNSVVQEVNSWDRAFAARAVANNRGYQVELCGRAGQSATQWVDASSGPMLEQAARHVAYVCRKYGIPPKWCTKADVDARRPGLMTHAMVTMWLEGTHTDPGPNFPFGWFASRVGWYLAQFEPPPVITPEAPAARKDIDVGMVKKAGEPAVWMVVPGVGRYHVSKEAYPAHLALYGKEVTADPEMFGPEVPAPGVSAKFTADRRMAGPNIEDAVYYDGTVDTPGVDAERDSSAGPQ